MLMFLAAYSRIQIEVGGHHLIMLTRVVGFKYVQVGINEIFHCLLLFYLINNLIFNQIIF